MSYFFKQIVFASTTLLITSVGSAQSDFTLYNMDFVPQSQFINPATAPKTKFHIGGSGFGGTSLPFSFNDIIKEQVNDTTIKINVKEFISKLDNQINVPTRAGADVSLGLRLSSKLYIHAGVGEKIYTNTSAPKDLMRFLLQGNAHADNVGRAMDLGGFEINAGHYREYFVGGSYSPNCNFSFGARFKYLQGFENIYTKQSDLTLTTDPNTFDLKATSNIDLRMAGLDTTDGYLDNKYNDVANVKPAGTGFGVDLGFTMKALKEKLTLGASLLDFGAITWTKDLSSVQSVTPNASYTFQGIDAYSLLNNPDSNSTLGDQVADSLQDRFNVKYNSTGTSYTTYLPTRLFLSGALQPLKGTQIGVNALLEFYNSNAHVGGAVFVRQNLFKILQLQLNANYYNKRLSAGGGLALNMGPIQFFVLSDNLVGTAIRPKDAVALNVRAGANFVWTFGKFRKPCETADLKSRKTKVKDADGDGVVDSEDKCPNTKGSVLAKGCPDADNDGLSDAEDKCPLVAGIVALGGCPDKDGDGIIDSEDACPNVYGNREANGCPDADNDGITDSADACPYDKGTKMMNGCPDRDKDGVADKDDACPDVVGKFEKRGCPDHLFDTDNDGLMDSEDKCIDVAGRKEYNGCPDAPKAEEKDTDNDGVLDKDDECPKTFGVKENKGCPEIKKEDKLVLDLAFKNLEFATGSSIISTKSHASLDGLAGLLKANPEYRLSIEGHTDNKGSAAKNLKLSKDRATAVKTYITKKGINANRIKANGFGSTLPISSNETEAGRQQNRRVEMRVIFE